MVQDRTLLTIAD